MANPYFTSSQVGAVNTLTVPGNTGRELRLSDLIISVSAQPSWLTSPNLQVKDGSNVIWQADLPPSGSAGFILTVPLPTGDITTGLDKGLITGPGNSLVVVVANPGAGVRTIINAKVLGI